MPNPTPGDMHVNRPLTDLALAEMQANDHFITASPGNVPLIRSREKSNEFFIFDSADMHRPEMVERARGSRAERGGYNLTTDTFTAKRYSLAKPIFDEDLNNFDQPLDPERDALDYLTQQALMLHETKWAASYFATSIWDTDLTGVAAAPGAGQFLQWDQTGATPVDDLRGQKATVLLATGFEPNVAYMDFPTWNTLVDQDQVIDRMQASGIPSGTRTPVTPVMMAELLGLDKIVVSRAIQNDSEEGIAASNSFILGKGVLLAYVNMNRPRVKQPSAFYRFAWNGFYGAQERGVRVKRYRQEDESSDIIEVDTAFVDKVTGTGLGVFFDATIA